MSYAEEEGGSAYDIIVVVQDNGEPTLSTTVAITVTVEEKGASDAATDNRKTSVMRHTGMPDITLYLIISLACVSAVFFLTFLILMRPWRDRLLLQPPPAQQGPPSETQQGPPPAAQHRRTHPDFVFVKTPMMSHNNTLSMTLNRKHLMNSAIEVRALGGGDRILANKVMGKSLDQ
ncbi:unnamed protein product [Coregonus sp. 'balchen']|nr:unnamed protein product [Coregonus sp. 'balchen']